MSEWKGHGESKEGGDCFKLKTMNVEVCIIILYDIILKTMGGHHVMSAISCHGLSHFFQLTKLASILGLFLIILNLMIDG